MLTALVLSGCLNQPDTEPASDVVAPPVLPVINDDGTIELDIPVDVVLIGFPQSTVTGLAAALEPLPIKHGIYTNQRLLYPESGLPQPNPRVNPMQPTAVYEVQAAQIGTAARLAAALEAGSVDGLFDANLAEDLIVAELEDQGMAVSAQHPSLVFVHLGATGHHYRMTYETGHVDKVRVYGERQPVLVMDVSAAVDPWVGDGESYNLPVSADGADTVDTLADAARVATHFRLLQGPLYPPTTLTCHGITILTVVRGTALTETLPGYRTADDYVEPDRLVDAWENLLGDGRVFVDHVVLRLPADDPELEAVLRTGQLEALRYWMDQNWDDYWVPHDGCEPYVSVFLYGDLSDSGVSGIATYDVRDGRRLSFSSFNDLNRMQEEDAGLFAPVFHVPDESRYDSDWLDFLYTHETGHLFGQRHPHDVTLVDGSDGDRTYSSIWSAMSYQEDGKLPQFGAIDVNNQARNRAGILMEAVLAASPDDPAIDVALERMAEYDWLGAAAALEPALGTA